MLPLRNPWKLSRSAMIADPRGWGRLVPADAEPACRVHGGAEPARAARRVRVGGAVLGVRGELVRVSRDVGVFAARLADRGKRALGRAVAMGREGTVHARTDLVERPAPELASSATAGTGNRTPEGTGEVALVGAGVAQVVVIPDGLGVGGRVARVRVEAWVEVVERSAADTGHPGLRRRVEHVQDRRAVGPDAGEGAGVALGPEHALALCGHLLEGHVLALDQTRASVVLADRPAGADRCRVVGVGDGRVLVQLGLPGEVVGRVVDDQVPHGGSDGELNLEM